MIRSSSWLVMGALSLSGSSINVLADAMPAVPAAIAAAISDPRRPPEQMQLDAERKPARVLAFARLKPGDRVADQPGSQSADQRR